MFAWPGYVYKYLILFYKYFVRSFLKFSEYQFQLIILC